MKDNKTLKTLTFANQLLKNWTQSHNFDLELNRLRRQGENEQELKRASQLCLCVFRKKQTLEKIIAKLSPKRPRGRVMHLLLPSMAAMLYMDKITPQGFADSAVETAKKILSKHEANFLNSFFHKLVDQREEFLRETQTDLNLGTELENHWRKKFKSEQVTDFAEILGLEAELNCRLINYDPPEYLSPVNDLAWDSPFTFYKIHDASKFISQTPQENFYIQDPATSLCISLLNPQKNEIIADLCSAPGGKTLMIAQLLEDTGQVFASDISEKRLEKLRENLAHQKNVTVQCLDARESEWTNKFDAILLDVPCSNTGVLRRKPDARWSFSSKKMNELIKLQNEILVQASKMLKPGGRICYSTCSIEDEENSLQVKQFLDQHPQFELSESKQLYPCAQHDGAFAAVLKLKA
ncbi:RsmB/NOP family class I SAM-dependent RNA methyltransferase [Lentisphaera profundi]|uniref:RsmB/NOP family class I SAM-dependent RNA methyltransferase n=1 Tax=Lentisphaera profundi TaxID=1658616 RepID=A0ABY7VTG4_9BACT|nr:RsmB/NOP family class I SAM-dependent RNA methyltransferase [Lentisphaera profundi]WDE96177.1 RsmB/NOP family class I SAM-dependent RNA methyltransferase [Lentisphaera profundi]